MINIGDSQIHSTVPVVSTDDIAKSLPDDIVKILQHINVQKYKDHDKKCD